MNVFDIIGQVRVFFLAAAFDVTLYYVRRSVNCVESWTPPRKRFPP